VLGAVATNDAATTTSSEAGGLALPTLTLTIGAVTATVPAVAGKRNDAEGERDSAPPAIIVVYYPQSNATDVLFPVRTPHVAAAASQPEPVRRSAHASADAAFELQEQPSRLVSPVVSISLNAKSLDTETSAGPTALPTNVTIEIAVDTGAGHESMVTTSSFEASSNNLTTQPVLTCVWWDSRLDEDAPAGWSESGCTLERFVPTNDSVLSTAVVTCSCNHLTHFGILFQTPGTPERSEEETFALTIASKVGVTVGFIGIASVLHVFVIHRDLMKRGEWIIVHLCIALGAATLMFVIGADRNTDQTEGSCRAVSGVLHYLMLACWSWQVCESEYLYQTFVEVLGPPQSFGWYLLVGWGSPLLFVIPSFLVFKEDYASETLCWIGPESNAVYFYIVPALCGLLYNWIMCGIVARSISTITSTLKSQMLAVLTFGTTLGFVYIIGALAMIKAAVPPHTGYFEIELLFAFGLGAQGFMIFYFHVFRKEEFKMKQVSFAESLRRFCCCGNSKKQRGSVIVLPPPGEGIRQKGRKHAHRSSLITMGSTSFPTTGSDGSANTITGSNGYANAISEGYSTGSN
jgi:hypothetical protein